MSRRTLLALVVALAAAALFARLGAWQLSRLAERRAFNRLVASRADSAAVPLDALPADTARSRFRRVRVAGTFDYANEIVLAGRSRRASPGVYLLTPLRVPGRDSAVLVYRGWVYSPDATRLDASVWREPARASLEGFVLPWPTGAARGGPRIPGEPRTLRRLDAGAARALVPYPLASYTVVALGDSTLQAPYPARLEVPPLDEGSHLSYAIQWFSFAAIALGGGALLVRQERRRARLGKEPLRLVS